VIRNAPNFFRINIKDAGAIFRAGGMKPEALYENLKELAEKVGITVMEKNLRNAGLKVKSGFCTVHEEQRFIMDKHLPLRRKNRVLGKCLQAFIVDDLYILPAVREFLEKIGPGKK